MADKVDRRADDWSESKPYPAGTKISRFTIVKPIGRGGCGAVYLAQEAETPGEGVSRQVALKVLRPEISDEDLIERFKSEIEALAQLSHSNIIDVYTQGISNVYSEDGSDTLDEGVYWFTMRYYPDGDVGQGLSPKKKFGTKRVARILVQVASALDDASSKGILHRDVKPRNILVRGREKSDESVVLADFGIAKWIDRNTALTRTHVPVGTARYSSPEQLAQKGLDGRSDQFSLACTAFELLIGSPLYRNGGEKDRKKSIPNVSELRKGTPKEIDAVLRKALSEKPGDRYTTCAEFARAFSEASIKKPNGNGAGGKNGGGHPPVRRIRRRSALLAVVALATVSVLIYISNVPWPNNIGSEVDRGAEVQDSAPLPNWKDPNYWSDSPIEVPFTNIPKGIFSAELSVGLDDDVYVAVNDVVKRMSSDSGGKSTEYTLPFPFLRYATGLDVDESGTVFVLDGVSKTVHRWEEGDPIANRIVSEIGEFGFFVKAGNAYYQLKSAGEAGEVCVMPGFESVHAEEVMKSTNGIGFCRSLPADLINFTVSRDGTLYVLGRNRETRDVQLFISSRGESGYRIRDLPQMPIYDLAVNDKGDLYFTATYRNEIFKITPGGSSPEVIYSFPEGHQENSQPQSIAVGNSGNIYTRVGNHIWRIFEK